MHRIAIIGPVGAGKSTFARELAARTGLPWIQLDDLYWRTGAVPADHEWVDRHRAVVTGDRWIIDGDYRATAAERFEAADAVIWLDPPRWRCLWRVAKRAARGYPAPLRDCIRWTWRYPRHGRRETLSALAGTTVAVHHLTSDRERDRLLARAAPFGGD